jgi:hypothetical protein
MGKIEIGKKKTNNAQCCYQFVLTSGSLLKSNLNFLLTKGLFYKKREYFSSVLGSENFQAKFIKTSPSKVL